MLCVLWEKYIAMQAAYGQALCLRKSKSSFSVNSCCVCYLQKCSKFHFILIHLIMAKITIMIMIRILYSAKTISNIIKLMYKQANTSRRDFRSHVGIGSSRQEALEDFWTILDTSSMDSAEILSRFSLRVTGTSRGSWTWNLSRFSFMISILL